MSATGSYITGAPASRKGRVVCVPDTRDDIAVDRDTLRWDSVNGKVTIYQRNEHMQGRRGQILHILLGFRRAGFIRRSRRQTLEGMK
ncbi:hypothetical protein BG60_09070 [Caballeronia zhejiangensis]|uniref:Uncharacterized protein n=1 Tax=Caballeronia zhejiangensis TaxID=871203 RepID=A0A656QGC2_9BURK|nr:hypothetical protein BG58_28680 [Caballeronia jiangsuensis]KDR28876.1 hypothetical protein BG60_09070 [Caballeronia zhejiangensis]KWU19249.1 hypothetical protein AS149_13505 [Burkholderia cenocepacia]